MGIVPHPFPIVWCCLAKLECGEVRRVDIEKGESLWGVGGGGSPGRGEEAEVRVRCCVSGQLKGAAGRDVSWLVPFPLPSLCRRPSGVREWLLCGMLSKVEPDHGSHCSL